MKKEKTGTDDRYLLLLSCHVVVDLGHRNCTLANSLACKEKGKDKQANTADLLLVHRPSVEKSFL